MCVIDYKILDQFLFLKYILNGQEVMCILVISRLIFDVCLHLFPELSCRSMTFNETGCVNMCEGR